MASPMLARTAALKTSLGRSWPPGFLGPHEVQAKAISVLGREHDLAQVPDPRCRLRVEGPCRQPTILSPVFDVAENPAEPVPAERLHGLEPGTAKSGIRDENRLT